ADAITRLGAGATGAAVLVRVGAEAQADNRKTAPMAPTSPLLYFINASSSAERLPAGQRQGNAQMRAAQALHYFDRALVQTHVSVRDRQAEARTANVAFRGGLSLIERVEHFGALRGGNARP